MIADTQKYCFMVDVSGSTGGSDNYWSTVENLHSLYAPQIGHYYEWDNSIRKVSKKEMEKQIELKSGKGGTSPQVCATEIVQKGYTKVILITDGQVGDHSVNRCDEILSDYKFEKAICYIIASSYGALNMSVTCPFTRNCENEVWEKLATGPLKKIVQFTPEDYKILDTLDDISLENFEANFEKIEGLIIALNMGKEGNIPLKNQLVVMKNRLVKQLSKQKGGEGDFSAQIRTSLEKGDFDAAIKVAQNLTREYFSDTITDTLEKRISQLINLCGDLRGKYDINQIKSNKMAIAKDAKEGQLVQDVEVTDLSKNPIQCPIILDEDIPQILVDECQPILVGFEKSIVDDITSCPLRILNYPEVKAKLKSRLSNFIGVKFADKFFKNPFTQNKLLGAIPLGCHKTHVQVGNYTIARMFSDGKILGNMNMFYAAIWYIIKEHEIEYLKDIEKNATEHLVFRLKNSTTMASLCGLAQFVTTQLSSDVAVWYCVNSGYLNQPTDRDTFRFHIFNINPLIDIANVLGYPIDKNVHEHANRTRALITVLSAFKKLDNAKKRSFKQAIKCLTQNSVEIDTEKIGADVSATEIVVKYVPLDGDANKDTIERIISKLPADLRKLSLEEIIHIGNLVDAQKQASDFFLDYNFKANPLPKAEVSWPYGLKPDEEFKVMQKLVEICPKTFRPYSRYGTLTWEQKVQEQVHIPASLLFKGRKYFTEFLFKYNRLPNKDELLIFYYNRYIVGGKSSTLPLHSEKWSAEFVVQYSQVMEKHNITVPMALALLEKSMARVVREQIEKQP